MGQSGLEFQGGSIKTGPFGKHPSFYPRLKLKKENKKTAQPATKNVDTQRVDTIVVVRGLTEPLRRLAAEDFSPGGTRRDALPLKYFLFYTSPFISALNSTLLKPKMMY